MNLNQIRRKVISPVVFLSVLAFTCIGGAVSAYGFMVSYKSRAVVFFEKSISDFRILEERLSTLNIFDRYQNGSKALLNLDAVEINTIRNQIVNPES